MDNNPLTYIFSTANLDAAGQRWVAHLASYNFALEHQKGKDNTVADSLSCMDDHLMEGKFQDYLSKIPYPGVKAVLDNAVMPLVDRAEQGVRPNPGCQKACREGTLDASPARLATTNVIDWKLEQKEDPVLYQVVKHQKASCETFKEALLKVTDQKATMAYVKSKEQLIMKNGLLYRKSKQGPIEEIVFQFVQLLMVAIMRQRTRANVAPYPSCRSNSGGQVWSMTSGTTSKSVVAARSLRLPHLLLH